MSKQNINEIVQQKLQELDYQVKPEYWKEMEAKIDSSLPGNASTAGAGSGTSSTFIATIAISTVAVVATASYFIFGGQPKEQQSVLNENISVEIDSNIHDEEKNRSNTLHMNEVTKTNPNEVDNVETGQKASAKVKSHKTEVIRIEDKNADNTESIEPTKNTDIDPIDTFEEQDTNIITIQTEVPSIEAEKKQTSVETTTDSNNTEILENQQAEEAEEETKIKDVTPINKPAKKVFKKKKGFLWF